VRGAVISRTRKLQRGHGAAVGPVARCRPSAVGTRDGAHDRQSEAGAPVAAGAPGIRPPEALEGVRQELRRETRSRVADLDHHARAGCPGRDHDRRSGGREPQRIVDQVVDCLADAIRLDICGQIGRRFYLARDTGRAGTAGCVLRAAGEQRPDVGPFQSRPDPVLITPGEEEELLGDARQPRDLLAASLYRGREFLPASPWPAG
jgi:hypothetical protein